MGVLGGGSWSGANAAGTWGSRGTCSREHARYPSDCRGMKVWFLHLAFIKIYCYGSLSASILFLTFQAPPIHAQNQACMQDGRTTPYNAYEETAYNGESGTRSNTSEFPATNAPTTESARAPRDRFYSEPRSSPPEEKRPPVVPLPAFQQAFGSTEIGKFAEAFSRTEVAHEEAASEFAYESFSDWDAPLEPQWSSQPASREIKCEDNFWVTFVLVLILGGIAT